MALSEDILKLKDVFNGANPLQAGMDQLGGTLQLPNMQDIQAPQVAEPQPLTNAIPEPSVAESIAAPQFDPNRFFGERVGNQPVGLADVAAAGQLRQPAGTQKFEPTSLGGVPTGLTPSIAMESGNFDPAQANAINPFEDTTGRGGLPQPYLQSTADQAGAATIPTGAEGSPQANFAARMASGKPLSSAEIEQANALAASMGTTFNPETGYSREPFLSAQGQTGGAPTSVENTQAELQRRFGAPTVSGALSAPTGLGLRTDPQGRMIPAGFETRADAFSNFERQSALREQRAAESFGQPRGPDSRDRDRRGTMSKADAVKLTGGDRAAADALLKRQELGLGEFAPEKAEQTGLTPEQDLAERKFELDKAKFVEAKEAKAQVDRESSLTNVRATQDAFIKLEPVAREIAALSGGAFTEGALGWAASKLPMATDAKQIDRLAKELEGTTFLQGLVEAKAKGATFGALSEREGDRILAARGKLLDPSSTNEQRIRAVNDMMSTIQTAAERARADHERKYGASTETTQETGGTSLKAGQVTTSSGKSYTFK